MRTVMLVAALAFAASTASAKGTSHYVAPHVTKNGTYVEGHMQTNPNGTKLDNWSTKGNVNPYTGKEGTKDPDAPPAVAEPLKLPKKDK